MAEYEINLENLVKMKRVFEVRTPSASALLCGQTVELGRTVPAAVLALLDCALTCLHQATWIDGPLSRRRTRTVVGSLTLTSFMSSSGPTWARGCPPQPSASCSCASTRTAAAQLTGR